MYSHPFDVSASTLPKKTAPSSGNRRTRTHKTVPRVLGGPRTTTSRLEEKLWGGTISPRISQDVPYIFSPLPTTSLGCTGVRAKNKTWTPPPLVWGTRLHELKRGCPHLPPRISHCEHISTLSLPPSPSVSPLDETGVRRSFGSDADGKGKNTNVQPLPSFYPLPLLSVPRWSLYAHKSLLGLALGLFTGSICWNPSMPLLALFGSER